MTDLISRQAAIDAVCMEWCGVKHQDCKHPFNVEKDDYYWRDGCETVFRTLPDLPSAEPERKRGKWIEKWHDNKHIIGDMACSVCGAQMLLTFPRFCPCCGAYMREEEQDE